MYRMRVAFIHKILPVGVVAFLLFGAPLHLVAQEREAPAAERVSVIEWFSEVWSEITAWLDGETPSSPPEPGPTDALDDACSIDPWGRCPGQGY